MSSEIQDQYELSPLQQGILFHSLYDGDSDSYVNQRSFLIDGPLDADALVAAWEAATRAHSVLRTSFHWEGAADPVQRVHREMPPAVTRHDWSGAPDAVDRFDALLGEDRAAGFDPASPPLQRLQVIRFGDDSHGLVWTHHLLLLDGWSTPVLMGDVLGRYLAATAGLPEPEAAPPFGDYIAWLRRQDLDAARAFWAEALSGWSGATRLGPLRPADPGAEVGPVAEHAVELPSGAEARLRAAAAAHRVTLNTLLHAAWALVLQRYSGEAEVTFGVTSSNRPPELPRVEQMVGLFTNTLPVRVAVPDTGELAPWLQRMQAEYAAVRRYEFSPLSQVKSWIGAPGGQPLFESLVIFDNYSLALGTTPIPGLPTLVPLDVFEKTSQPLVLLVTPQPTFSLRMRWHRDRFAAGAAERMLEDFRVALVGMAGAGRVEEVAAGLVRGGGGGGGARAGVDARSGAETETEAGPEARPEAESRLASQGPVTVFADAGRTLPELFERRVAAAPDALAVVGGEGGRVRYRELAARARGVAAALVAAGVGRGDVVGVCAERSVEMVAALVGVGLAGAAYLPLEPTLPGERLAFMVREAGARVVLAQRGCAEVARGGGGGRVLILEDVAEASEVVGVSAPRSDDTAYVIYTSGSTGRPKGAAISHRAIVNRLLWMQDTFALTPEDRVLQKTPFGFDVSVWELFWPLIAGATMVSARPGGHQDAEYLAEVIERQAVTTAHFVPSMLQLFLDEPKAAECGLRRVVCSGEALSFPLAERVREALPHTELHNLYGPTEAAVDVTWWDCARPVAEAGIVPIGEPIANTRAYVLDRRLAEAPDGVPGELYLAGVQLARGYVGRPGLTAAAFVAHPLAGDGGRLYRTGDRVRRLPDGTLDFLGRVDRQVKIHGYRVEPGEVEQALAAHPDVKEAAVVLREAPGGPRLAAYVTAVAPGKSGLDVVALRDHLRTRLPRYMLPATITVLPAMPLSHNGKLLRAALPDPSGAAVAEHSAVPTTVREQAIADVFRDLLGLAEVDTAVGFFELGGTSFDAVRAIRRIEGASVALLGAHPSVRELAAALDGPPPEEDRRLVRLTGVRPAAGTRRRGA